MIIENPRQPIDKLTPITTHEQLNEIDAQSADQPVFIMKHSTRCGISHAALEQVENFAEQHDAPIYILDLLNHRDISNAIADRYDEPHASPQLFYIKDGELVAKATHYSIDQAWMEKLMPAG